MAIRGPARRRYARVFICKFADGRDVYVLEYPTPPPLDMSGLEPEHPERSTAVLAPYLSAVVSGGDSAP